MTAPSYPVVTLSTFCQLPQVSTQVRLAYNRRSGPHFHIEVSEQYPKSVPCKFMSDFVKQERIITVEGLEEARGVYTELAAQALPRAEQLQAEYDKALQALNKS